VDILKLFIETNRTISYILTLSLYIVQKNMIKVGYPCS